MPVDDTNLRDWVDTFSVTPSQILPLLEHVLARTKAHGTPKRALAPFIWGPPGIGKTDLIRSVAALRYSRLVSMHLAQYDPTDLKGIPINVNGKVVWMPTSYLPQQKRVRDITTQQHVADFAYATDVAVYLFDRDGKEVARWNDPTLSDMNGPVEGGVTISRSGNLWTITLGQLPGPDYELLVVDKAVIFLDELSAADPSTQNAALQLVLDRRVGEYDVPFGVPIIAAGNREEDGAFVQTMSAPLINRIAQFTLRPDWEDWVEWAVQNDIHPHIIGMIAWKKNDALLDFDASQNAANGQNAFPSPRSWAFLSDQYLTLDEFERMSTKATPELRRMEAERLRTALFSGIIGAKWASDFVGYLGIMADMPSIDDIVAGKNPEMKKVERSQSFGFLYALLYTMVDLFEKHYDPKLKDKQPKEWTEGRDNILGYIAENFDASSGGWFAATLYTKSKISSEVTSLMGAKDSGTARFAAKYLAVFKRIGTHRV